MTWLRVGIEIELTFVWVVEIDFMSVWDIKIDLIQCRDRDRLGFLRGSEMTWFQCMGIEIDLIVVRGVDIDLVFVCGPKMTCF